MIHKIRKSRRNRLSGDCASAWGFVRNVMKTRRVSSCLGQSRFSPAQARLPAAAASFSALAIRAQPLLVQAGMESRVEDEQQILDQWPKMPDGSDWDGFNLVTLLDRDESPFKGAWDVQSFILEVEQSLNARVADIPSVSAGANHYVSGDRDLTLLASDVCVDTVGLSCQACQRTRHHSASLARRRQHSWLSRFGSREKAALARPL